MLHSLHTSLDSRLRGNDMNNYANLCNQALPPLQYLQHHHANHLNVGVGEIGSSEAIMLDGVD